MGRPINSKYIKTTSANYIECTAWVTGDTQARTGTIVKQNGSQTYWVSTAAAGGPSSGPGPSGSYLCKLQSATPTAGGQMQIAVAPTVTPTSAATVTVHMGVTGATIVSHGGTTTPYQVGDTLTVVGGTGTAATFTVNTVSSGGVATFTIATPGSYTVLPTNPVSVTDSPTTGASPSATFNLTSYDVVAVTSTGGSGYGNNNVIDFSGGGYTTPASATMTASSGTLSGTATIVSHGSGYTTIPTATITSLGTIEYVYKLNNTTVYVFSGEATGSHDRYKWEFANSGNTNSGLPGDLPYAVIQSNTGPI
jgi:hypothetical protein